MEQHLIKHACTADRGAWDEFVRNRQDASLYHLYEWRDVIEGAYGLSTHYLMLTARKSGEVLGVLPLVHLKHFAFGNQLVSMPFADGGGILARSTDAARLLASGAERIASGCGAEAVELRQEFPLPFADEAGLAASGAASEARKVRMLLGLPGTSAQLARGFKSKLRSQINRPLKEGCSVRIGGLELLEDFYKVFLINMRDLGSPVHSKELMRHVLEAFPEHSRIFAVHHAGRPIAASLVIGFNGVLRNPWAASDRCYAAMSPNMLLYSRMLEFACDTGTAPSTSAAPRRAREPTDSRRNGERCRRRFTGTCCLATARRAAPIRPRSDSSWRRGSGASCPSRSPGFSAPASASTSACSSRRLRRCA
jgi:serine/alanine adding enzyme